jgi:hypothetical protein
MTQKKPQPMRGLARVTFRANAAMIRTELEQGWTAKAIFERHHAKLGTMSYRQFLRHIAQELGPDVGRSLVARSPPPRGDPPPPPLPAAADPPAAAAPSPSPQGQHRAGHEPANRGFNHDPLERPDDRRRLLGEE